MSRKNRLTGVKLDNDCEKREGFYFLAQVKNRIKFPKFSKNDFNEKSRAGKGQVTHCKNSSAEHQKKRTWKRKSAETCSRESIHRFVFSGKIIIESFDIQQHLWLKFRKFTFIVQFKKVGCGFIKVLKLLKICFNLFSFSISCCSSTLIFRESWSHIENIVCACVCFLLFLGEVCSGVPHPCPFVVTGIKSHFFIVSWKFPPAKNMPRGKRRANHDMGGEDDRQTSKRQRNTYTTATATAQNTSR